MEEIIPLHSRTDIAIVIVTYNNASLIINQVELIKRFCTDAHDIIIVDNSTKQNVIDAIQYYNNTKLHCQYHKTWASSTYGSDSHSFAANNAYTKFCNDYSYFFYLDHDCFPIKEFSIKQILKDKIMVGVGQNKEGIEYFWPGCVMWDNTKIDHGLINFSINREFKLDTGGELRLVIEKYGKEKCTFINEIYCQNPNFNKSIYNYYALINDGMFMHFINGSNWTKSNDNDERINSLLNILEEKTK